MPTEDEGETIATAEEDWLEFVIVTLIFWAAPGVFVDAALLLLFGGDGWDGCFDTNAVTPVVIVAAFLVVLFTAPPLRTVVWMPVAPVVTVAAPVPNTDKFSIELVNV